MHVCRSPQNASEFEQYYQLRWLILRKPWHQPLGSERDGNEETSTHRMIIDDKQQVLAVGRLEKLEQNTGQIRFMAVAEHSQGQGLGKQLMSALEYAAKTQGLTHIMLHARENAEKFYCDLGYKSSGLSHLLYGKIQHVRMTKQIVSLEIE